MIHRQREAEIERLLREGGLSPRVIAQRVGVARSTVERIANGRRAVDLARSRQSGTYRPRGRIVTCDGCGARVESPCRACRIRRLLADGRLRPNREEDPPDDRALTIDLRDGDPETYLRLRRRKERKLLGAMLAEAEVKADADPQGDVEPGDAELAELQRELEEETDA